MIETCETSLTWLNETTYNCSIEENGLDTKKAPGRQSERRYQDLYKCKFELTRERERKEKQKLELYALKP
jgi:hypothetical protein